MSIYNRDNINYSSMIDNAIRNRLHTAERDAARIEDRAKIKSQAVKDMASTFARGMDYLQYDNEQKALEKKLKDLEDRRDYIRNAYAQSQDYKPYSTTDEYKASEYMKGYKPNVIEYSRTPVTQYADDAKTKWLQAHPGMTEEDYDKFVEYYNSIYGGR